MECDCNIENIENANEPLDDIYINNALNSDIENSDLLNLKLNKKMFNIGNINIQGLSTKFDQFKLMLTSKENNISIMGISETKFTENHKTESFIIDGYQLPYRRDRLNNGGGGLLVYVKQNVNCIRRPDLEVDELECIWLEIMPIKAKSFLIGSMYRHPDSKVAWNEKFDSNIQ